MLLGRLLLLLQALLLLVLVLLVGKLGSIELGRIGHEGRGIHHARCGVGVIHVWKAAAAIVVRNSVVHPSAHGVRADELSETESAIKQQEAKDPLNGARLDGNGAGRTARRVVMGSVESRRGLAEEMSSFGVGKWADKAERDEHRRRRPLGLNFGG